MISVTSGTKKTKTNEQIKLDTEKRTVVAQGGLGGVGEMGEGVKRYRIPVINKLWGYNVQHAPCS